MRYICSICGYVYDEDVEKVPFSELPDDWACPMCKAPKSMFEAEGEQAAEAKEARPADVDSDMMPLSPGVLAALFSNLARGAEKQYKAKESEALGRIAEFFTSAVPSIPDADLELVRSLSEECTGSSYPAAKATASAKGDRGALRACTWAEKVERIIQVLIARYESEGEAFLDGVEVWVCSVCGFIYVGNEPPAMCPVCKVPAWKFEAVG